MTKLLLYTHKYVSRFPPPPAKLSLKEKKKGIALGPYKI